MPRIRVFVIDDSALMRQLLTEILQSDPELEVVGTAADPIAAREKILRTAPDVLTLDVEMPRMDGLTFLEQLMRARPLPVVMISSLTERGCHTTLRALELGAVDFVTKPRVDVRDATVQLSDEIVVKVKGAARARVFARQQREGAAGPPPELRVERQAGAPQRVIAIGASTGGPEALRDVLLPLPADAPPIIIVQHMPEYFTGPFAKRLDSLVKVKVEEARSGDRIVAGRALIAPGDSHMEVMRSGGELRVRLHKGERVNRHRPSVDVLFDSCAAAFGAQAVGVILTGMGGDGARGLLAMRNAGAHTIAQDEASSVVFGMPKEAVTLGAAAQVLPLRQIPAAMLRNAAGTRPMLPRAAVS